MTHQMITTGPDGYQSEPCDCDAEIDHGRPVGTGCEHDPDRIENDEVTADEHERTCLADPATRTVGWHITPGATTDTVWDDPPTMDTYWPESE